jgi:hypothetical protein
LQRRADGGLLWGAIGLHGGLVGGWFALQAWLLELLPQAPSWLAGPGGAHPNPIGGLVDWAGLGGLLLLRRPLVGWRNHCGTSRSPRGCRCLRGGAA